MNYAPSIDRRGSIRLTGAVYTPSEVAAALAGYVRRHLPRRSLSALEPSAGDGAFLGQLASLMPDHAYVAVDIDAKVVNRLRENAASWPATTTIHARDFIEFACDAIETDAPKFDLIIGNPPFIRKHNFPDAFKDNLKRLAELTGYPLADLKNSWAAFLIAAARMVSVDGIVAFVLPYELITVAYGHAALKSMRQLFPRIDLFVSDEKAFPEIEQDAVIFVGHRRPSAKHGVFVQHVQQMSDLSEPAEHALAFEAHRSVALDLNAFLIDPAIMPDLHDLQASSQTFGELATSAPGVVTAANAFFILKDAEVDKRGLRPHVLPILKKQNSVNRSPIFSTHNFEELSKDQPCRFLHVQGALEGFDAPLQAYIAEGVAAQLPERHKCRNRRRNWYEVPLVKPAPGFFFKRSYGYPRMCINEADVHITDTAYGIRPKDGHTMRGICFSFYNSVTMLFAETNGRFYGGGVLELSPNELRTLPVIYHEPTDEEFAAFLEVHERAGNDPIPVLDFGDEWLAREPAAKGLDLAGVRRAWSAVRAHRLRHSNRNK